MTCDGNHDTCDGDHEGGVTCDGDREGGVTCDGDREAGVTCDGDHEDCVTCDGDHEMTRDGNFEKDESCVLERYRSLAERYMMDEIHRVLRCLFLELSNVVLLVLLYQDG